MTVRVGDFVVSSSLKSANAETLISYVFGSGEETVGITNMREPATKCGYTAYRGDVRVLTAAEFAECIKHPLNRELVKTFKPRLIQTATEPKETTTPHT